MSQDFNDIYHIVARLDRIVEGTTSTGGHDLNPQQKSVPQLPALFKPRSISVLGAKKDPEHPMKGYAVGTSESAEEPQTHNKLRDKDDYLDKRDLLNRLLAQAGIDQGTRDAARERIARLDQAARMQGIIKEMTESGKSVESAVARRIVAQHADWLSQYGVEAVLSAIESVAEDVEELEELGSSDVSAYTQKVKAELDSRMLGEIELPQTSTTQQSTQQPTQPAQNNTDTNVAAQRLATGTGQTGKTGVLGKAVDAAVAGKTLDPTQRQVIGKTLGAVQQAAAQDTRLQQMLKTATGDMAEDINEGQATEDVLSTVKKKLGDYLQDVATAIKKDPDLVDQIPRDVDQIKAVKTIQTDDGHEIKIHGNEDDGFRISIKNKDIKRPFKTLDEATMACEMYCARRRDDRLNADYMEER